MEEDLDRALALEQEVLGPRVAFPCGCVLPYVARYPDRDWSCVAASAYCGAGVCEGHASRVRRVLFRMPGQRWWIKADGSLVTQEELKEAMQAHIDRQYGEELAALRRMFRSQRLDPVCRQLLPPTFRDPVVVTEGGYFVISALGEITRLRVCAYGSGKSVVESSRVRELAARRSPEYPMTVSPGVGDLT